MGNDTVLYRGHARVHSMQIVRQRCSMEYVWYAEKIILLVYTCRNLLTPLLFILVSTPNVEKSLVHNTDFWA